MVKLVVVVAHPDDEAMFFSPLLQSFKDTIHKVYLLCLSSGNFDQKGETRKRELEKSCALFGITTSSIFHVYFLVYQY